MTLKKQCSKTIEEKLQIVVGMNMFVICTMLGTYDIDQYVQGRKCYEAGCNGRTKKNKDY